MADFFTRIAERTLGLAAVVRPDLPSAFATSLELESSAEFIAARHGAVDEPAIQGATEERAAAEPLSPQQTDPEKVSPRTQPLASSHARKYEAALEKPREAVPEQRPEVRLARDSIPNVSVRESAGAEANLHFGEEPPRSAPQRFEPPLINKAHERIVTQRIAADSKPAERDSPSTVRVTIGRVDVRATPPPAPAVMPKPAERRASPLLSLDEYLKQRNEGRR